MITAINSSKMLNIALRGTTLITRFVFVFFLAKLFNPSDLGLYGLVTAAVGYVLYLVGLDFYTYTTRELLNHDRKTWGGILKNQVALSLILYALVLPALMLIFVNGLLPWSVAKWFYLLIILEHVCQEMGRLFIAISEQLFASILLFLRQGTWAIAITGLMLVNSDFRSLGAIFAAWSIAGMLTIFIAIYRLHKLQIGGWTNSINWKWIIKGIKVSVPLLIATLAIRGVFTVDRYWLKSISDLEVVGAYVLFFGVSSTLSAFLDAGVFSYSYPTLIKAYQSGEPEPFRIKMREMLIHTTLASGLFSVVSLVLLPYLLLWLNRPAYTTYQYLYPWLLSVMVLNALGMVPHYALYAQKRDRPIIQSHILGFIIFNASAWVLSINYASIAIPAALCVTFTFILFWKTLAYVRLTPVSFKGGK
ncbi:MAG: oligosaccharide flippase family protein [Desulfuromonadaceae bacterium]|nr:oligosaccharide flippase family protein [Desulfuromonadaceae bacterium]